MGIASGVVAIFVGIRMIRGKLHARERLIHNLIKDSRFITELKAFREAHGVKELDREIEQLQKLIQEQISLLDDADRARIESSLYQPSSTGRVRYIEKLASDASRLEHAAAQ